MEKSERDAQKLSKSLNKSVYEAMYSLSCNKGLNAKRIMDSNKQNVASSSVRHDKENSSVHEAPDVQAEVFELH